MDPQRRAVRWWSYRLERDFGRRPRVCCDGAFRGRGSCWRGEEVRGGLADLSFEVLRRCAPVRCPGVYQRQRHMPARWFSTTAGRFLEYESLLERDWMLLLDFDREIEWICEQPLRLRYQLDDKLASHVPDLLVWRAGRPELCDVKSVEAA
jgi:hypothetical protein